MPDFADRLVRHLVSQARARQPDLDTLLDPEAEGSIYRRDVFGNVAHVFLALSQSPHPSNLYAGGPAAAQAYRRVLGGWLDVWERSAGTHRFPEWPIFIMGRGLELLGDELDPDLRRRTEALLVPHTDRDLTRPFFFTAPNHEIWKLAGAALGGRLLGRADWRDQAAFEAEQMLAWQTDEGFWEEGRHHGPSMKYNFVTLAGLTVLAEELGNNRLLDAARRLAAFVARWVFPDGLSIGAFDGRRTTGPGRIAPGMELVPEGVTLMERSLALQDRCGWLDPEAPGNPARGNPKAGDWLAAESLLRLTKNGAELPHGRPLATDTDGATLENHTATFEGVLRRRGSWCIALSGQLSDVPKDTQFIYRLERQNRIEIWHERASGVVGGGHSLVTAERPLYNAWVEPGYRDEPEGYAAAGGNAGSPAMARRRSKYYPRAASSGTDGERAWLELVFAHATVRFDVEPNGSGLLIRYEYRATGVEELRLALPLLAWEDAAVTADGRPMNSAGQPVEREVRVETPLFGTRTILTVPDAGRTRVLALASPMQSYREAEGKKSPRGTFTLAPIETVFDKPDRSGAGTWRLRVE
jgi:hypothetical protein